MEAHRQISKPSTSPLWEGGAELRAEITRDEGANEQLGLPQDMGTSPKKGPSKPAPKGSGHSFPSRKIPRAVKQKHALFISSVKREKHAKWPQRDDQRQNHQNTKKNRKKTKQPPKKTTTHDHKTQTARFGVACGGRFPVSRRRRQAPEEAVGRAGGAGAAGGAGVRELRQRPGGRGEVLDLRLLESGSRGVPGSTKGFPGNWGRRSKQHMLLLVALWENEMNIESAHVSLSNFRSLCAKNCKQDRGSPGSLCCHCQLMTSLGVTSVWSRRLLFPCVFDCLFVSGSEAISCPPTGVHSPTKLASLLIAHAKNSDSCNSSPMRWLRPVISGPGRRVRLGP